MEQHPIPQQISSYEFRLVGSMTLRQFFKLAGGLVIAFIFYSSRLPFLIKWPLVLGFGFFGVALAFLPVNERPLEIWIMSFFKSIFSPTIYLWQKQRRIIDILESPFQDDEKEEEEETLVSKEPQLEEFLASLPQTKPVKKTLPAKKVEKEEKKPPQPPARVPEVEIELPQTSARPQATAETVFGEIPMPQPPLTPGIVVGMITDENGKIVENTIIEIQDAQGNPIRALRTNQLGQFKTATPLAQGEYLVLPEKEGYQFDIIKIKAEGKVIPPLKITARS